MDGERTPSVHISFAHLNWLNQVFGNGLSNVPPSWTGQSEKVFFVTMLPSPISALLIVWVLGPPSLINWSVSPYDPITSTAFLPGHANYWTIFKGVSCLTQGTHTLQCVGPAMNLPPCFAYACILSLCNGIMVLNGFAPHMLSTAAQPLLPSLTHSSLNSQPFPSLIEAIKSNTALGMSDGFYMPTKYLNLATAGWILLVLECCYFCWNIWGLACQTCSMS